MTRILAPLTRFIEHPWQTYFVGMLFGLGFDTTTEIVLLALANSGPVSQLPWYAIACLPLLFAAGMTLLDTVDGSVMNMVYDATLISHGRRVHYNLIITGISMAVALVIATTQILGLLGESSVRLGTALKWVSQVDPSVAGAVIVVILLATWCVAIMLRKGSFHRASRSG
jgi:high-affinity nickel-transport protein